MALDMFLILDAGKVEGESVDSVYGPKKAIDIMSWSWGAANHSSAHMGGGSGAGKVAVHDISITKYTDKSTPILWKLCCDGSHLPSGEIIVRKAGGGAGGKDAVEYVKIVLDTVFCTSTHCGGSGGEDRLTESITLSFRKFKIVYQTQNEKGAAVKGGQHGWDVASYTTWG